MSLTEFWLSVCCVVCVIYLFNEAMDMFMQHRERRRSEFADYCLKIEDILEQNDCLPLEDEEIEWCAKCFHHGDPPSMCAYGVASIRDHVQVFLGKTRIRELSKFEWAE